jgi:carboxymethylenebutenolidase
MCSQWYPIPIPLLAACGRGDPTASRNSSPAAAVVRNTSIEQEETVRLQILGIFIAAAAIGCGGGAGTTDDYADRMAHEHRDDAPVANPMSDAQPAAAVVTEDVVYATVGGRQVTGYLARPEAEGPHPAVIVIHEWWGLNDNVRSMARQLAGAGYAALAVDLYGGEVAEDRDTAYSLMQAVEDGPTEDNLRQAYEYLAGQQAAPAVASLGWCFGGGWSLRTALLLPDRLDATVIYYGRLVTDPERLAALEMPILGLFGALDEGIPLADVRSFESALTSLDKQATIIVYEGADHAFANPSGRNYQAEAAEQAWQETVEFLGKHLR